MDYRYEDPYDIEKRREDYERTKQIIEDEVRFDKRAARMQAMRRQAVQLPTHQTYEAPVTPARPTVTPKASDWGEQYKKMLAEKGETHSPLPVGAPNRYLAPEPEPEPEKKGSWLGRLFQSGGARKAYVAQAALLSVVVITTLLSSAS